MLRSLGGETSVTKRRLLAINTTDRQEVHGHLRVWTLSLWKREHMSRSQDISGETRSRDIFTTLILVVVVIAVETFALAPPAKAGVDIDCASSATLGVNQWRLGRPRGGLAAPQGAMFGSQCSRRAGAPRSDPVETT